jgi:hypothetical protein
MLTDAGIVTPVSTRPMPTDGPHRLILYERPGCHLCEDAATLLDAALGAGSYARVDIDADDDLVVRYGFRVPVVSLDGVDRLEAPMTASELRALLRSAGMAS